MDLESKGEELKVDGEDILLRKYEQLIKDGEEKNAKVLKASLDEMIETNDNGSSDFMNLFRTQIYSEIKWTECEYMETCFEDRIMMELDLPNGKEKTDLIKWFQKTFEKVLYGLENDNYCERWEKKTSFTREEWITRLPKIMIIHLKRFKTNEYGVQERNNKSVEFPINNLDFPRMIHFYFKEFYQEYSYDLYGISIHSGTLQGGHYTANIKNMNEDKNWYNWNDSSTRDIEQPDNFGKGPYVLFYLRNDAKE